MIHPGKLTQWVFKLSAVLVAVCIASMLAHRLVSRGIENTTGALPDGVAILMTVLGFFASSGLVLAGIAIIIWMFVFWLLILIDGIQRTFESSAAKVMWILAIIFIGIFAAIPYYWLVLKAAERDTVIHDEVITN